MMSQEKRATLNIALVGGGFMAKAHSNAYHTIPDIYNKPNYRINLDSLSAATIEEAEESARRYSFTNAYEGYEEAVAKSSIDIVDICAADFIHKDIAVAALAHGKHVLCEKPLANSLEDARTMYDAAVRARTKTMCGFNYRFVPAVRLAKILLERGIMGRIYTFNGAYNQDSGAFDDIPLERLWYAYGSKASGVSYGIGSHIIDMARFLVGEITTVSGLMKIYTKERPSNKGLHKVLKEEEMLALVEFNNEASGILKASAVAAGRKNQLTFEISCSKGSLSFDLEEPNYLNVFLKDSPVVQVSGFTKVNVTQIDREHPFMDVWWPRGHGIGWEHAHINEIAHFLDCIANNKDIAPYGATFKDGLRAIEIIEAIRLSDQIKSKVKVNNYGDSDYRVRKG